MSALGHGTENQIRSTKAYYDTHHTPAMAPAAEMAGGAAAWAQGPAPHGSQPLLLTLALQITTNN